jgi:hypothetical protein
MTAVVISWPTTSRIWILASRAASSNSRLKTWRSLKRASTSSRSRLQIWAMHAGSDIISPTTFRLANTAHRRSFSERSGAQVRMSGVWRAWYGSTQEPDAYILLTRLDLRTHHRRLPLRSSIRHEIRQRRRPHRTNHRTSRHIPEVPLHIRQMVTGNLQSQRRTAQHPPPASLGAARCIAREVPLFGRGGEEDRGVLTADAGATAC